MLRIETQGRVRVLLNGFPMLSATTDANGWVSYLGDAASGRVMAPLGATNYWVTLAGGYAPGIRETIVADGPPITASVWGSTSSKYTPLGYPPLSR